MRIIIRRPHAYAIRDEKGEGPIPGLLVLDADGRPVGGIELLPAPTTDEIARRLREWGDPGNPVSPAEGR